MHGDEPYVDTWCREHLGAGVAAVRWTRDGIGVVHALDLDDGRAVVVKEHHRDLVTGDELRAVVAVQARIASAHGWAPAPLAGPLPFGDHLATAESRLDGGPAVDDVDALATRLRAFVTAAGAPPEGMSVPFGLRPLDAGLWPPPHGDFDLSAPGGEWIDDVARGPRALLAATVAPRVVGHLDWRSEHVRMAPDAVHDWDSLGVAPEEVVVGAAASSCTVDFSRRAAFPTAAQSARFVAAYGCDGLDVELVDAAHTYVLAYIARCSFSAGEHLEVLDLLRQRSAMGV